MTPVEFKEFWLNDQTKEVYEEIDDSWRHGNYMYTVFEILDEDEKGTGVYYGVSYQVSGDGEYHTIRDSDEFYMQRVTPVEEVRTVTIWQAYVEEPVNTQPE